MKKCNYCQENEAYKSGLCEECLKNLRSTLKASKQKSKPVYGNRPLSAITPIIISLIGGAILFTYGGITSSFPWALLAILFFIAFLVTMYSVLAHLEKISKENHRIIELLELQSLCQWKEIVQDSQYEEDCVEKQ